MDERYQEVRFDIYCQKCKHKHVAECADPCNDCLEHPVLAGTNIPERFEKKKI